ncbi:hypothetical protein CHS0354_037893 [Potamilus streckersoni]|uniref:ARF7 effector protein C-terminal domain-containing protein n=1 Tax=Potamilus streckersoni TaxID=2493646 RepID=A0AAE0T9P4_9BIVA|nr:hypothetical protein CHS0354_037893 [Potamilus streckersoni]
MEEVLLIDDDSGDQDENSNTSDSASKQAEEYSAKDSKKPKYKCRCKFHAEWGNNDTNLKFFSKVPPEAIRVFRDLGQSSIKGRRFCQTCINKATSIRESELEMFKDEVTVRRSSRLSSNSSNSQMLFMDMEMGENSMDADLANYYQAKQLRMLSFLNPGKLMEDFDPERSTREMRKMSRRIFSHNLRKNQMYDDNGFLLEGSRDLCDCLNQDCPGCHMTCPKCSSEKCGTECRANRRWVYDFYEIEGTNTTVKWPFQTQ